VRLALPDRWVPPAPRALKVSKDPSVLRAQSESRGRPALRDRQAQSAPRGRRVKRVPKARSDPPASADHQGRKVPLAHPAPPDHLARRVTPGPAPAIRVVTGTDSVRCEGDEILAGFVCASGATDGAKCATPGTAATGLCVHR
jgi:hypothetical protein